MTAKNTLSLTIIIPTFNEVDNIEEIIKRIQLSLFLISTTKYFLLMIIVLMEQQIE